MSRRPWRPLGRGAAPTAASVHPCSGPVHKRVPVYGSSLWFCGPWAVPLPPLSCAPRAAGVGCLRRNVPGGAAGRRGEPARPCRCSAARAVFCRGNSHFTELLPREERQAEGSAPECFVAFSFLFFLHHF